ncbi:MAG: hypothetical protein L6V90_10515 [Treponema succinifaciens]|nr:MAG: hypothetical protein L6V90_10515 [Treponema succinifaciens]
MSRRKSKLSEKTHAQSENVAKVIGGIIDSVQRVVEVSEVTSQIFSDIVKQVSAVDSDFKEMSGIIENENSLNISVAESSRLCPLARLRFPADFQTWKRTL